MYGQFIPIQSVNRSALEYDITFYGRDEFHVPPAMDDPGLSGSRELRLHYQPVALPKPYYFEIHDAIISRDNVVARANPYRVFLENFPEVSRFTEGENHWVDRRLRHRLVSQTAAAPFNHERAYWFPSRAAKNYYHFLIDSCLRYVDLQAEGIITPDTKILFNLPPTDAQRWYIAALGISDDQIVVCGKGPTKVRDLILSASRRQRFAVSRAAIDSFNTQVRARLRTDALTTPRRFLVSRSGAATRRVQNEPELVEALKPFGFDVVRLEELSPGEQIALFSEAECIVAPHGAGLANLIYCTRSPTVIELIPGDFWGWGYFIQLTHTMGGTHRAIVGQYENTFSDDFLVDVKAIVAALSGLQLCR